jgi:hypothetical protein
MPKVHVCHPNVFVHVLPTSNRQLIEQGLKPPAASMGPMHVFKQWPVANGTDILFAVQSLSYPPPFASNCIANHHVISLVGQAGNAI